MKAKKWNFSDELSKFYETCKRDLNLNIIGLMCIPPNNDKSEYYFSLMKKLKNQINLQKLVWACQMTI